MAVYILTNEQMRWADARTIESGVAGAVLMERAGNAVARAALARLSDGGRVVVVAGAGNNGGDGYAAARLLAQRGVPVTVAALVAPESLRGDAAHHVALAQQAGVKVRACNGDDGRLAHWLARAMLVVDAVFGTGLSREVAGAFALAVEAINQSGRPVLAVDIPSGVHGDSGAVMGAAVRADWTLPIAATKWGCWLGEGREYAGELLPPADIGILPETIEQAFGGAPGEAGATRAAVIEHAAIAAGLFPRPRTAHKGDFGHVWIFGGSPGYTGAPRLAAAGAMAAGAGLVSIACPDEAWPVVASASLEAMAHPQASAPWHRADVVAAGPGWGRAQQAMLGELLASGLPLVLDADALNMLAADASLAEAAKRREALTVLTPHPGEAARLLGMDVGRVQEDRPAAAIELARRYAAWVVLKGAETLVAAPDARLWLCPFGSNRLARGGTGDVLAGVLAALLARGVATGGASGAEPDVVAARALPAGVALHALAGETGGWHRAGQLAERIARLLEDESPAGR